MIVEQSKQIVAEVGKAFIGKNEIVEKVLMTIYAGGHVLLQDCPGVGKTTLALAFSRVLGLQQKRIQFTTDTMPSDITGFTVFNRETNRFEYQNGAADCQLLLADEINRTSPKTQAALLEAMEEHNVTVDGITHPLPSPFVCIATQNPLGAAGTQPLPESQLDRFMVCLTIGYPSRENQISILNAQRYQNPLNGLNRIASAENVMEVQQYLSSVRAADAVLDYAVRLCEATREHSMVALGISPRGIAAVVRMARASAILRERNYVIPEDVQAVFVDVCAHRLVMRPQARVEGVSAADVLNEILHKVQPTAALHGVCAAEPPVWAIWARCWCWPCCWCCLASRIFFVCCSFCWRWASHRRCAFGGMHGGCILRCAARAAAAPERICCLPCARAIRGVCWQPNMP